MIYALRVTLKPPVTM